MGTAPASACSWTGPPEQAASRTALDIGENVRFARRSGVGNGALMGGTDSQMIANVIERQFKKANDWPFGAALSFILIYAMFILIALQSMRRKVPEAR